MATVELSALRRTCQIARGIGGAAGDRGSNSYRSQMPRPSSGRYPAVAVVDLLTMQSNIELCDARHIANLTVGDRHQSSAHVKLISVRIFLYRREAGPECGATLDKRRISQKIARA